MTSTRLNPSAFGPDTLDELAGVLSKPGRVALIDEQGNRADLPKALFDHLMHIVQMMAEKRTVVLVPEDEECTTQAAADVLGVSRQHLVDLLERGEIPFHKVGTHRRVVFRDVLAYQKKRDKERSRALDKLMKDVSDAGLYDASYTGGTSD